MLSSEATKNIFNTIAHCKIFKEIHLQYIVTLSVRERSALATLIFTSRVCLSVIRSVILSCVLSVRKVGAKYLGNEAR